MEYKREMKWSEWIQADHQHIPLKGSNETIGIISKIIFQPERIYAVDRDIAKQVFVYDREGNLLFNVGKVGEGPGEYKNLSDLVIVDDELIIVDNHGFKLLYYDLLGNFKREMSTQMWIKQVQYSEQGKFVAHVPSNIHRKDRNYVPNTIQVLDPDQLGIVNGFLPYQENLDDSPLYGALNAFNGEILYLRPIYGDIIDVSNLESSSMKIGIDYGNHAWPIDFEEIVKNQEKSEQLFYQGGIITLFNNLVFNADVLLFQGVMNTDDGQGNRVDYETGNWLMVHQRDENNEICYGVNQLVNDINDLEIEYPIAVTEDGYFVSTAFDEDTQQQSLFLFRLKANH